MKKTIHRVAVMPQAAALIRRLKNRHGPLVFHQSGGCCDGSSPMCFMENEFRIGESDIFLGMIEDCPFYIGAQQFEYWSHTRLVIDVVKGRGASFSLEIPEGLRFLTRSEILSDEECRELDAQGPPPRGAISKAVQSKDSS